MSAAPDVVMIERDADGRKADACAGMLDGQPAEKAYFKQPLNDATLDALHKLVARGGVAAHAAQEMLDAELIGADAEYAARLRGRQVPPPAPPSSWLSRCRARWHGWFAKK